jgi:hypothetical protein
MFVLPPQVKGLKYNDFRFIANQPITPADIAAVASTDTLASTTSSSSSVDSLAAAKQQQQQVEMQPQLPSVGLRWVAACCNSTKVSATSADTGLCLVCYEYAILQFCITLLGVLQKTR